MSKKKKDEYQLRLVLTGLLGKRFGVLKRYYGFEHNADLARMIITKAYEKLESEKKLPQ